MPVDFFAAPCAKAGGNCKVPGVVCTSTVAEERFGISDRDADQKRPAFVDTIHEEIWDVTVSNPAKKKVTFKAIDQCVDVYRTSGYDLGDKNRSAADFSSGDTGKYPIKKCEGFLQYGNNILFLELKRRKRGNWLKDAREKFEETLLSFLEHNEAGKYNILSPVVANNSHVGAHQNEMVQKRILKDKTGFDFYFSNEVVIK